MFTLTIATFVTIADRFLAAYMYEMSKQLGPYVPLIIVNCIIICRCEVCASKQGLGHRDRRRRRACRSASRWPWRASPRCARSSAPAPGSGCRVLPEAWPDWVIMVLPPGAFLTLGLLLGAGELGHGAERPERQLAEGR